MNSEQNKCTMPLPAEPVPVNEEEQCTARDSGFEMMKQGNRNPALRGIQSTGGLESILAEDDLPEWLRAGSGGVKRV